VGSGQGEILEFFTYEHVSRGNCMRRRREDAIADGKKPLPTRGSGERRKPKLSAFWDVVNLIFSNNQIEKVVDERSFC